VELSISHNRILQIQKMGVDGINAVVTGGSGFVGQRLVEMLLERGAKKVVSFDIAPKPKDALTDSRIVYVQGDLTRFEDVDKACEGADCVWHVAALVGPYYPKEAYRKVNYEGSLHVLEACRKHKVRKIVFSSSPSTRFDGNDIDGLRESDLKIPKVFLQEYAETKAMGEKEILAACCDELMTVAIAPHQVYGPRDPLMLPNLLLPIGRGQLRIFGNGKNKVSFCYVDNYCHGLIIGFDALYPGSPALGKFYIVTDGPPQVFWDVLDVAGVGMGFRSLKTKFHLPVFLLMFIALVLEFVGTLFNHRFKLNTFSVKMLTIHRWFNIEASQKDLKYEPIVKFETGWATTIDWFKENWLPHQKL